MRSECGLPGALEATAALLRAQLWKERHTNDDPALSSHADLEPQYGIALVKFVSEIIEPEQLRLGCGMREAGLSLGIPDWIVDLRNETAHASSRALIDVLHSASILLLRWLRQHYWEQVRRSFKEREIPSIAPPLEVPASETFVYSLLTQYRDASLQMYSHGHKKKNKTFREALCSLLSQISAVLPNMCDEVIKYLITSDFLLQEEAADLCMVETAKEFHTKSAQCSLPSCLRHTWSPLVTLLRSDIQYLAEGLVKVEYDEQKSVTQKYLAAAWLLYLLNSSDNSNLLEGDLSFDHMPLKSHLNIPKLLKLAVKHTGCYTMHMVKGLVAHMVPPLSEKEQYNLFALVAIQSGSVTDEEKLVAVEHNLDDYIYTPEDLLEIDSKEEKSATESKWKLYSGSIDWEEIPVGAVPGCQDDTPNLSLNFKELRPVRQQTNVMESTLQSTICNKDPTAMECEGTFDSDCKSQQLLECVHNMMRVFV
ncbi:uncharacterized protein LOC135401134 isoform X2 [Ornithodoros turicata]|uniref:uncharacterized protein LOC135401134 isoform X2 n=1 Tax=Ornithodoros turicata TaxID=34597 RepID=UPI00313889C8